MIRLKTTFLQLSFLFLKYLSSLCVLSHLRWASAPSQCYNCQICPSTSPHFPAWDEIYSLIVVFVKIFSLIFVASVSLPNFSFLSYCLLNWLLFNIPFPKYGYFWRFYANLFFFFFLFHTSPLVNPFIVMVWAISTWPSFLSRNIPHHFLKLKIL